MDLRKKGIMDSTNYAEITVKFYYNQEFKKNVDNIDMYFQEVTYKHYVSALFFILHFMFNKRRKKHF